MPEQMGHEGDSVFTPAIEPNQLQAEAESKASLEVRTRDAYEKGESEYWAGFGRPGHEREYTVHDRGYDSDNYMPKGFDNSIKKALGDDWGVLNRGSRIEISFLGDEEGIGSGEPNDQLIEPLLEQIFNRASHD